MQGKKFFVTVLQFASQKTASRKKIYFLNSHRCLSYLNTLIARVFLFVFKRFQQNTFAKFLVCEEIMLFSPSTHANIWAGIFSSIVKYNTNM